MNILKELNLTARETKPATSLVWRRKHGRGAGPKAAGRMVWTLTPVAAR